MRLLSKLVPGLALLCSVLAFPAAAQSDYPNRPIKWIVPYPPAAPPTCWRG
jgi:tripartite-type tricarboxylate transporter receptor subunit TctC